MNDAQDDDVEALRVQRLNDYLRSMLAKADPTAACVGAINTGLMTRRYDSTPPSIAPWPTLPRQSRAMDKFSPYVDRQMRLGRTVERLARFVTRILAQQEFPPKGASGGE